MAGKVDYKTLAITKELEKLHIQHENEKKRLDPVNKGGRADVFKKRYC